MVARFVFAVAVLVLASTSARAANYQLIPSIVDFTNTSPNGQITEVVPQFRTVR